MSEDKIAEDLAEVRGKILKGDFNWASTNGVIVCSTKEFSRMERRIEELEQNNERLFDWLMDENREKAVTKFTSGELRNLAREIEFRIRY